MNTRRQSFATTGVPGLDAVLGGIEAGDNIVWEVDNIADYHELVVPYATAAHAAHRRLIYFRFAKHPALLPEKAEAERHDLEPTLGFESFVRAVHGVIENTGRGAIYVFDCLSQLADTWGSDQALGNRAYDAGGVPRAVQRLVDQAAEILDQPKAEHDRDRPQFAARQRCRLLIRSNEILQPRGIQVTVGMADQFKSEAVDSWVSRKGAVGQAWKLLIIVWGEVPSDEPLPGS